MADVDEALWALEEAVEETRRFTKAAAYGLRLATKRIGDLTTGSQPIRVGGPKPSAELEDLAHALANADEQLTEAVMLLLGDRFRAFLAQALDLVEAPPLPDSPAGLEELTGTPGSLTNVPRMFTLALQLYRAAMHGGRLDRRAFQVLGTQDLELPYAGGKMKLYREGDRVALSESHLTEMGEALLETARALRTRLLTA